MPTVTATGSASSRPLNSVCVTFILVYGMRVFGRVELCGYMRAFKLARRGGLLCVIRGLIKQTRVVLEGCKSQ